jgi:tetratricopeptide (TPR) repeat protein
MLLVSALLSGLAASFPAAAEPGNVFLQTVSLSTEDDERDARFRRDSLGTVNSSDIADPAAEEDINKQIAEITQTIVSDPKDVKNFLDRGRLYIDLRDVDHAIADYMRATQLDPEYFAAFSELGNGYAAKGQLDRAIEAYDRAIAIKPDFAIAYNNRGRIYDRRRDYTRAIADYDRAVRYAPDNVRALNDACWTRAVVGRELDKALVACDRAISLRPLNANYLDSRGFVYFRLGRFADAISDYSAALARDPKMAATLYMRGVAKLRLGEKASGNIDIAGAKVLNARVDAQFTGYGVKP